MLGHESVVDSERSGQTEVMGLEFHSQANFQPQARSMVGSTASLVLPLLTSMSTDEERQERTRLQR